MALLRFFVAFSLILLFPVAAKAQEPTIEETKTFAETHEREGTSPLPPLRDDDTRMREHAENALKILEMTADLSKAPLRCLLELISARVEPGRNSQMPQDPTFVNRVSAFYERAFGNKTYTEQQGHTLGINYVRFLGATATSRENFLDGAVGRVFWRIGAEAKEAILQRALLDINELTFNKRFNTGLTTAE